MSSRLLEWLLAAALSLIGAMAIPGALAAEDLAKYAQRYDQEFHAILVKYCNKCHGGEKTEGGLNLAALDTGEKAVAANVWAGVIERFSLREMPPEGNPHPSDNERSTFFAWTQGLLASDGHCNKIATDVTQNFYEGHVMSRRLTRAEYNHTVRDLFGLDTRPADAFPADGAGGEGFDTLGDSLFTNPILFEKYLEAADQLVETALADSAAGLPPVALAARERVFAATADPQASPDAPALPRQRAQQILLAFARRAYRRPVGEDDIAPLLKLYDRAEARGDGFLPALRLALKGVLLSPNFLFLVEPEPEKSGVFELGPWPLASRLSYFLWGTMPDDELFELAASGKLSDPEMLRAQTRRMLSDPRSMGFAESFATQWLGIGALGGTVRLDAAKFPEFDGDLAVAMKGEAIAMFDYVLREDRSLLELLDADYTLVNERMARNYGIPDVVGPEFRRVSLSDRNRGGVLAMASVLAVTSYPLRTSPVLRGKWVLSDLLGNKTPPPPPNVPSLPDDDAPREGLTLRAQLEQHRSRAECNSCHSRMDPLGFGLENFDPLGRWRSDIGGQPVDASGQLPNGAKFNGPAELKQVLLHRKHDFLKNLTRKMLGYALGRELTRFDDCVVDGGVKALEAGGYRSSLLVEHIALSYPFNHRYAKK